MGEYTDLINEAYASIKELNKESEAESKDEAFEKVSIAFDIRETIKSYKGTKFVTKEVLKDIINQMNNEVNVFIESKKGEYEGLENKSILEQNTEKANQNRLLDLYFAVLKDEKHFTQRTQPLGYGTDILKDLSEKVREWKGIRKEERIPLFTVSPAFQMDVKSRFGFGGEGLGPMALANVHHSLSQFAGLYLKSSFGIGNVLDDGTTSIAKKYGKDGELISEWFSALIDAHVDIAADPFIYYLNCNKYTRDVIQLMIRMGVGGVNTFLFASQPIVSELTSALENEGSKLVQSVLNEEVVINDLFSKLNNDIQKHPDKSQFEEYSIEELMDTIQLENDIKEGTRKTKSIDWLSRQYSILKAYQQLKPYAQSLTQAVMASRVDTKGFGNNISQLFVYNNKFNDVLKESEESVFGIGNFDRLAEDTFIGTLTENSINMAKKTLSNMTLEATPAFLNAVDIVLTSIGKRKFGSDNLVSKITDELFVNVNSDFFVNTLQLKNEYLKSLIYGNDSVPKMIYDIKNGNIFPELKDNSLIKSLYPHMEQDKPDSLTLVKPDDKWHKDELHRAWKDMLNNKDKDIVDFAKDLFYYSYFTSGFKNTINSFFDIAPREMLVDLGYNDYMKEQRILASDPLYLTDKLEEMYLNAWNNDDIVPRVNVKNVTNFHVSNGRKFLFELNKSRPIGKNSTGQLVFRPYVKIVEGKETSLFKYIGYNTKVDKEGNKIQTPVYRAIEKKSYYNKGQVVRENNLPSTVFAASNKLKVNDSVLSYLTDEKIEAMLKLVDKSGTIIFKNYKNINLVKDNIINLSATVKDDEVQDRINKCM